jgi:tellurium resistance protein TerD
MTISLKKGEGISLKKEAPGITKFYIALGWDEERGVDPDVTAFCCKTDASGNPVLYPNTAATEQSAIDYGNLVFFNNPKSADGAVVHGGDNRTGKNNPALAGTAAADDDEQIVVDIAKLDPNIDEIAIVVTIDKVKELGLDFSRVRNSFIRICQNDATGRELAHHKITEDYASATAVAFGSLLKDQNGDWDFTAASQGFGSKKNVVDFEAVVGQYLK